VSIRPAAAALAAALALLLAGCALAPAGQSKAASHRAKAVAVQPVRRVGPPAGSRAEAYKFAQRLLSAVTVPHGTRMLAQRRRPAFLRLHAGDVVDAAASVTPFRLYRVPMPMSAVIAFVQAHLAADVGNQGWGKMLGGPPTGSEADRPAAEEYVDAQARRVPVGIAAGELLYAVVPGRSGTSVLQVNAQVVWYHAAAGSRGLQRGELQSGEADWLRQPRSYGYQDLHFTAADPAGSKRARQLARQYHAGQRVQPARSGRYRA
jgi:hypothetical protein